MTHSVPALRDAFDRTRDEASFRRLYRACTPALFALAVRLSGSRAEAEELVQEAWVRAVERHDRFDGRSAYTTWLAGILVNCHREAVRRRQRGGAEPGDREGGAAVAPFPRPVAAAPPLRMDVERALAGLADGYREVVLLHDLHGYTHREIAAMLEIDEGTSKSQLHRGRARLRELLGAAAPSGREEGGTA